MLGLGAVVLATQAVCALHRCIAAPQGSRWRLSRLVRLLRALGPAPLCVGKLQFTALLSCVVPCCCPTEPIGQALHRQVEMALNHSERKIASVEI